MPFWRTFYHLTWATKDRQPTIANTVEAQLHRAIVAKAQHLGALVHAVGGIEDHVHLVASVAPKIAISEFVRQVKGSSSHFANHEMQLPYGFCWQSEYGVVTFDDKSLDAVVSYVRNQREHHLRGGTLTLFETTGPQGGGEVRDPGQDGDAR